MTSTAMNVVMAVFALAGVGFILLSTAGGGPSAQVQKIAIAIATAEGFYVANSRSARNHNPGDMTKDLIGKGVGFDGPFVIYKTDADGWADLYAQVGMWLDGSSKNANSESTIEDISGFYTTTEQTSWAANVADVLGVDVNTPIGEIA
jgi:hypothetical protein